MSTEQSKKINVAVVGGGMGGLSLAIGLLQHANIDVQIYEAAHKFSEIGAGVAFGPNAQRALRLISPEVEEAYLRQATHHDTPEAKKTWFQYRFGTPERDGELILDVQNETGQSSVHRAKFLDEFIALVPPEVAHFGKRLERVEDHGVGKGVTLYFKDGTTANADCVIGADGIHSVVREFLLGKDHPALKPQFTGSVAWRGIVPMDVARKELGDEFARVSINWLGHGGMVSCYPIDHGSMLNIAAINSTYKSWDGPWQQPLGFEKLQQDFTGWGENTQKIIKLLNKPDLLAWSFWDLPSAPTYCRGNVVMMGDAAHASTPFQAQGAGQAIEDAYVLESLFETINDPAKIPFALQAYDRIRRPRSQRVVTTSRETAEIGSLRYPGIGDNVDALRENFGWRMDWMWHRDIKGERDEAIMYFEELLAGRDIN